MADLQRSMDCIWNTVRARIQADHENSDAGASADSLSSEKFSPQDSSENFIRADLVQIGPMKMVTGFRRGLGEVDYVEGRTEANEGYDPLMLL